MALSTKGKARVLYFVRGSVPSAEQLAEAEKLGPGVAFRNATMVRDTDPLEHADIVAGDVPDVYRKAYAKPADYANSFSRGAPFSAGPLTQAETDAATDVQRARDADAQAAADKGRDQRGADAVARGAAKAAAKAGGDADAGSGWGTPNA